MYAYTPHCTGGLWIVIESSTESEASTDEGHIRPGMHPCVKVYTCVSTHFSACTPFILTRFSRSFRRSLVSSGLYNCLVQPCTDMLTRHVNSCGVWCVSPHPSSCVSQRSSERSGRTGSLSTGTRASVATDWRTHDRSCFITTRAWLEWKDGWGIRGLLDHQKLACWELNLQVELLLFVFVLPNIISWYCCLFQAVLILCMSVLLLSIYHFFW